MQRELDLNEAGDVWQVAHTILVNNQNGGAQAIETQGGGHGDSKHHLIWVADVRKLVEGELETFLLDCVYGDSPLVPDVKSKRGARDALRKFCFRLADSPDVYRDYHKMRSTVYG